MVTSLAKLGHISELPDEPTALITLPDNDKGMEVLFRDVSFRFSDDRPILNNISFHAQPNSITVIQGRLGSGKSLLLNMLAGFYQPSGGSILFDNVPVTNLDKAAFRDMTGIYLDDMKMIKGTLLDNIIIGRDDVTAQSVLNLAEAWGIEDFSSQFTQGLLTPLSDTNTELSFSSRKKILLLRSMLGSKRLLLLEDPIDGMDETFSAAMLTYLRKAKQNSTIVIVSENNKLVQLADQVLILENGNIVQQASSQL